MSAGDYTVAVYREDVDGELVPIIAGVVTNLTASRDDTEPFTITGKKFEVGK